MRPAPDLLGIVVVAVPVTDLSRSAAWYMIALSLRSTTQGRADLRGEHPIILEARDAAAADRVRDRATALGIAHSSGCHADGTWTQFSDPDGICLRLVHDATGPRSFLGVRATAAGGTAPYQSARLALPTSSHANEAQLGGPVTSWGPPRAARGTG